MRIYNYNSSATSNAEDFIKATRALSDETRLRILMILLERDCCVCEVMQALDISQTRASRNLNILQEAGFLSAQRDRFWTVYRINRESGNQYAATLARLLQKTSPEGEFFLQDRERLQEARRIGPGCRTIKE
ncbi:ArsR/SmtB family transcription factor [Chloroflexota bacterium]